MVHGVPPWWAPHPWLHQTRGPPRPVTAAGSPSRLGRAPPRRTGRCEARVGSPPARPPSPRRCWRACAAGEGRRPSSAASLACEPHAAPGLRRRAETGPMQLVLYVCVRVGPGGGGGGGNKGGNMGEETGETGQGTREKGHGREGTWDRGEGTWDRGEGTGERENGVCQESQCNQ